MILADKIIDLRKKNGWSQEDLAEQLDVSRQSISKWESAQSVPDMARILRMSELFGVSTDYLLKDELGLIALIVLIGCAVALFVTAGLRISKYEPLEKQPIDTLYGVAGMVRERREQFRPVFYRQLTIGIVLCVVAVIPIGLSLLFGGENEFLHVLATGGMLALIAVGVLLIVRTAIVWDGFQILLEEGDYTREAKEESKRHGSFGKIYWLLVTAAYLAWSFLSGDWQHSWIVWPIAAVAYGAIFGIAQALRRKKD